jgi:hypothetical protein
MDCILWVCFVATVLMAAAFIFFVTLEEVRKGRQ